MDLKRQERLYEEAMGKQALERQLALGAGTCRECGQPKTQHHRACPVIARRMKYGRGR